MAFYDTVIEMPSSQEARQEASASTDERKPGGMPTTSMLDVLPIPENTDPAAEESTAITMAEEPSLSHALATATDGPEEKGVAQQNRRQHPEVEDLGWNERKEEIVSPLVGGLSNEDLWLLIRRFDKV